MRGSQAAEALDEFLTERSPALVQLRRALAGHGLDPDAVLEGTPESVAPVWEWITRPAEELGVDPRPLGRDPTRPAWPSWASHLRPVDPHPPARTLALVDGFTSYLAEILTAAAPGAHWRVRVHRIDCYPMLNHPVLAAGVHQVLLAGLPLYSAHLCAHGRDPMSGTEMADHTGRTIAALRGDGPVTDAAEEPLVTVVADVGCFDVGLRADLAADHSELVEQMVAELTDRDGIVSVYRDASPPPGYSLDTEVDGALSAADARGWHRFHLVGYSGGGAAALACAASHPGRLLSLGLLEPAWAGTWDWSPRHERLWADYDDISRLPHDQFMAAFMRLQVRTGVPLPDPPPGPPPPWMARRPGGIRALMRTFRTYDLDREALAAFDRPVYFALGGLSNPDQFAEVAERLGTVFADFTLELFPERHHFDPPHRTEPARLAQSLMAIWSRGDQMMGQSEP